MEKVIYELIMNGLVGHNNYENYKIFILNLFQGDLREFFFPHDDFLFDYLKKIDFLDTCSVKGEVTVRLNPLKLRLSPYYKKQIEKNMLFLKNQIQSNIEEQKKLFLLGDVHKMQLLIDEELQMTQEYICYATQNYVQEAS